MAKLNVQNKSLSTAEEERDALRVVIAKIRKRAAAWAENGAWGDEWERGIQFAGNEILELLKKEL